MLPADVYMTAALFGQILELTKTYNWEQTVGISVADTVALWEAIYDDMAVLATCNPPPVPGGDMDYVLQSEILLSSPASTIQIVDLELLDGIDLLIEVHAIATGTARRHLRCQANGVTSANYEFNTQEWRSAVTYFVSTTTYFQMRDCVPQLTAPLTYVGYAAINIPQFRDTDRYPLLHGVWNGDGRNGNGHCYLTSRTDIQSVLLFLSADDFAAGTKISVYTRGS